MAPEPVQDLDEKVRRMRRSRAASIAAYSLHEQRPELAAEAGRRGGLARAKQFKDPQAMGRWLARRRWYGALAGPPPGDTS
jgi:hypothetical protein